MSILRAHPEPARLQVALDESPDLRRLPPEPEDPVLLRRARTGAAGSVFETEPSGLAAEQFRLMQHRLVNSRPKGGCLLVTSPICGDGKSLNALNLAWALAEAGTPTLLLELDLRRPAQANHLGAQLDCGVEQVLSGELSAEAAVRRVPATGLRFLGPLQPARRPIEQLRSPHVEELFRWAARRFRWVVLDTPPILPVADIEELLPRADLVVMIVRERSTPRPMVQRAVERLGRRLDYMLYNATDEALLTGYEYRYR